MILSAQLSGADLANLAFVGQGIPGNPHRLMATEGQPGLVVHDTLAGVRDGAARLLDTIDAEIDRVAIVSRAAAELARHNAHPCTEDSDHTDPDLELLVDASAVEAAQAVR